MIMTRLALAGILSMAIFMVSVTPAVWGAPADYDANANGTIEKDEVIVAIRDYFAGGITKIEAIELIRYYFSGGTVAPVDPPDSVEPGPMAELGGLSLTHGDPAETLMLAPAFSSADFAYTASVGYEVVQVTVTAMASDGAASAFVQEDGITAQPDADSGTEGHQVTLTPGENVIRVAVTAGDASQIYIITVSRAKPTVNISAGRATADEGTTLLFTVTRSPVASDAMEVTMNVAETGGAIDPGNEGIKTVTIAADAPSVAHALPTAADDAVWNTHSTVTVTLQPDDAYTVGSVNSVQTQVRDDDFPQAMELVMATSWYQDGITTDTYHTEPRALRALQSIANNNPDLANTVLGWPWIFDELLVIHEAEVLEYLSGIDKQAPELTQLIINLTWLADKIDGSESFAMGALYELVMRDQADFAVELATAPWVTDGVTYLEVLYGITSLQIIASSPDTGGGNPEVARQIMDLIRYPPDFLDLSLIWVMSNMRAHTAYNVQTGMEEHIPDRLDRLVSETWFVDGLDQKERVYLIAAIARSKDRLYEPYTIATKAIELPLAGPVNLWVVGHHQFDSRNILATMERAVKGSEDFWKIPFPIEHVILYVWEPGIRGKHIGFVMFLDTADGDVPQMTMFHEVAHYYFRYGPRWFTEGGAIVVAFYVHDDGTVPDPVFSDYCAEQGLENLQDWTELGGGELWDICSYGMGLHFLLTLRDVMGEEAWLSALRALYLEYGPYESSYPLSPADPTDEDIYRVFMEHAPSDLVEKVNDVFRRLHGGPFISQAG